MNERSIFIAVLEMEDSSQRNAYLADACGADPALRERVEKLLAAHRAVGGVLDRPLIEDERTSPLRATAEAAGLLIAGRYKLLEEIGEGGMGTVWVAQQTEPIRRRVALKLIKPGMDSRQVLSRFEAERQALALMDHPNIARVLDGGVTDQGRPFFVMEYVKGVPITDYCDQAKLTLQERLKLFVQICQAVQHAHQKGIIHRDLKPSNVLVCLYDGKPVPKVIDFGLAKAIHQSLTEHTLYTAHGLMLGTPRYMSPEQAEFNNLDIDTRSDVYSLGVILYELLTGTTPLEKQRFKDATLQEILRLIKEEEATRPSTKLSGSGSLPTIAAQRSLEPAQLSRAVRGDLDWIVMKSLEKERSRRYETANGLARDIERYLHDDPVEARPPSAGYRFSKFARRNKAVLLTVGLVAAALVVGTMVSTWQAIRATRAENLADARLATETEARAAEAEQRKAAETERAEAEKQRAQADANFRKAKLAVDKYFTLVSESKLFDVPGLESLRKDLLEAAVEFYEGSALERTDDPALLAELAATYLRVSQVDIALNRLDDGFPRYMKALDIVERLRREHPGGGDHELKLAGFWKGLRWTRSGVDLPRDLEGAFQVSFRLEAIWKQLAAEHPAEAGFQADLVWIQCLVGQGFSSSGRAAEGKAYFRKARAIAEKLVSDYPQVPQYRADLAMVNYELANNLYAAGETNDALARIRQAVQLSEKLVTEFPKVPAYRGGLARFLWTLADQLSKTQPGQAEESYRRAMDLSEALVREFPDQLLYLETWVRCGMEWASFEISRGNNSQAEDVMRTMIETAEKQVKERPEDRELRAGTALCYHRVADRLLRQGNHKALAERLDRRALVLFTELSDEFPDDPSYRGQAGWCCRNLGRIARVAGRLEEAREHYAEAAEGFGELAADKALPQRDGYYRNWAADSLSQLAQVLADGGHVKEAVEAARQSVDACQNLTKEYPGNTQYRQRLASALGLLAECLVATGQKDEADDTRQRMLTMWETFLAEHPKERQARQQLAWALSEAADKSQANPDLREPLLRRALALHAELANETPGDSGHLEQVGHGYRHLGWLERSKGQSDNARKNFELGLDTFAKLAADKIPQRDGYYRAFHGHTLIQIAIDLAAGGHVQEAAAAARRSVDVYGGLLSEFPSNLENRGNMAQAARILAQQLVATGQPHDAVQACRQQVSFWEKLQRDHAQEVFKPQLANAYLSLSFSLTKGGTVDEAQQAWEKAVEMGLSDANALNQFAWNLVAARDVEPALATLAVQAARQATKATPSDAIILNTLGVAQYRAGQWEDAIQSLVKAEELAPDKTFAFNGFFLAMAHWQLDHKDEAHKWYDRSVEWMEKNQPKNEELARFRAEAEKVLGITQPDPAPKDATQGDSAKPES
jgi:serine/threonine protein kinase/tetratricopeptide (TPR) repeat protein